MIIENIKRIIEQIDIMEFKEGLYYLLIFFYSMAILYVLVFKTDLLVNQWFIGGVVAIIYLILKQLKDLIKNDKKQNNKSN